MFAARRVHVLKAFVWACICKGLGMLFARTARRTCTQSCTAEPPYQRPICHLPMKVPWAAVQASTVHIAHLVELGETTLTRESLTLQSFALQNQVGSEGGRGGTGGANESGSEATSLLTEAGLGRIEPWDDIPIAIL